jgi:phosphoglycolate phosphatase
MARISGILFDKDGTLIDLNATWVPVYKAFLQREKALGHEHMLELMQQGGYDPVADRFTPDSLLASGTTQQIVELWYPELDDDAINHKIAMLDSEFGDIAIANLRPVVPLAEYLTGLRDAGLKIGVATNDTYRSAMTQLEHLGVAGLFDLVMGADSVASPKPSGDMIRRFSEFAGMPASAIAMVGDTHHDLAEARAGGAGLSVGVLTGSADRAHLGSAADVVLDSIAGLPAFLGLQP